MPKLLPDLPVRFSALCLLRQRLEPLTTLLTFALVSIIAADDDNDDTKMHQ